MVYFYAIEHVFDVLPHRERIHCDMRGGLEKRFELICLVVFDCLVSWFSDFVEPSKCANQRCRVYKMLIHLHKRKYSAKRSLCKRLTIHTAQIIELEKGANGGVEAIETRG